GAARERRDAAGERGARDVQSVRRHMGCGGARGNADRRAALRTAAHVDARRRGLERLPPGRLRRAHEQEQRDRGAGRLLVTELARVYASVELLQPLDLVDVVPRLVELDPDVLPLPTVDVVLAGVVGREREPLVLVVAVEEVAEVP